MTIRPDDVLQHVPVFEWTEDEVFAHLQNTFDRACRDFPDAMERYAVAIVGMTDRGEMKSLMRQALRDTLHRRFAPRFALTTNEAAE